MLSPAQFAELIALIQTTHDEGGKSEVRRSPRLEHPCRVTINLGKPGQGGPELLVQLKDISARGMSFVHNQVLPAATAFIVRLEPGVGKPALVPATVVHCRPLDGQSFQIGARFSAAAVVEEPLHLRQTAEDLMQLRHPVLR